jgi:hypothetical protein
LKAVQFEESRHFEVEALADGVVACIHNWATDMIQTVADWVEAVRNNEALREDLRNAEVITLWLGWHDVVPRIMEGGPCHKRDGEVDLACLRQATKPMREGYDELLSEIVSLTGPNPTIILIADVGIPSLFLTSWKEHGALDVLKVHAYEVWRDYILEAAGRHHVYVVYTYEELNDPNGDQEMPSEYMQSDGLHFNEHGHRRIAEFHRKVGYETSR